MSGGAGIENIRRQVAACTRCGLHETRTNPVPGAGNFRADVVFVGEAPGRNEDLQGEPFVGAAGRILSAALEKAGMSRDEVYITNAVKCRPPGNRTPLQEERAACSDYLRKEIGIISPRIICVMGNTAFGSLLGGSDIMKHRGKIFEMAGRLYFVSLHPAAAIYNRSLAGTLEGDIMELARIIRRIREGGSVKVDHRVAA